MGTHPDSSRPEADCLVVGAGLAGLRAALELKATGLEPVLVDKGRVPGGRLASRGHGEHRFDYGAPVCVGLEANLADPLLREGVVEPCRLAGLIEPAEGDPPVFCAAGGIRSLAEALAPDLDVRCGCRVAGLEPGGGGWQVALDTGETLQARSVVLTPPAPQTLELLDAASLPAEVRKRLEAVTYDPCLALLVVVESGPGGPGFPGGCLRPTEGPFRLIVDNHAKGASPLPGAITALATTVYSRQAWEEADVTLTDQLLTEVAPYLGASPTLVRFHRWRYSRVANPHPEACEVIHEPAPLVLAGDGFAGGDTVGALRSGLAAARAVVAGLA